MHKIRINEKRCHDFEREQGGIYRNFEGRKKKGETELYYNLKHNYNYYM